MKVGCVKIKIDEKSKEIAQLYWKGAYLGSIFGDGSNTQILILHNVKNSRNEYGHLCVEPTEKLIKLGEE